MMTICRAFLTKQLWRLAGIVEKGIVFCDNSGRLSLSTCTAHPNCEQLNLIITEGFLCEVLSWKMDVEEPDAAMVISTAANEVNSAAMRTTEIQAFKVLKGEIIIQMSRHVGQTLAFQSVIDRVKRNDAKIIICNQSPTLMFRARAPESRNCAHAGTAHDIIICQLLSNAE